MQMCCSPHTKAFECTKFVYQTEGLRAFYRSYWTALSMNIPYQMTMVVTYGLVQRHFNPEGAYNPAIHFLAGAAAGGVASVVTMPLDVCKTLLNTQESAVLKRLNKPEVRGLRNAARTVFGLRGFRGFFQGLMPRILYQVSLEIQENSRLKKSKNIQDYEAIGHRKFKMQEIPKITKSGSS